MHHWVSLIILDMIKQKPVKLSIACANMYKDAGDVLAMEAASCYGKLAVAKGVIANLHQLLAKAKLDIQHLQERLATNESVVWSQEVQPTAHLAGIHNFIALLFACMAACWLYSGTHAFLIDQHATAMARRLLSGGDGTGGELYASFTFMIIHQHVN